MMDSLDLIKKHEACRLTPYRDSIGVLTIGWGTNIEKITQEEADFLLLNRFHEAEESAAKFPWFVRLDEVRQAVIENMIYNMGLSRFLGFKKFIAAVEAGKWEEAKKEMMYNSDGSSLSPWAKQVGYRALELAEMMRTGHWPGDTHG